MPTTAFPTIEAPPTTGGAGGELTTAFDAEAMKVTTTTDSIPAAVRAAISQRQTALRQHGLSRFIAKAPGLLATLELAGLRTPQAARSNASTPATSTPPPQNAISDKAHETPKTTAEGPDSSALVVSATTTAETSPSRSGESETARIEKLLIEDPFWCEQCDGTPAASERRCPITNKPHRRFLVVIADAFLRLVGDARVTAALANPTVPTTSNIVARRGIPINPQLLLLAYHTASMTPEDVAQGVINETQYDLAVHLVQCIDIIKNCFMDIATASNAAPQTLASADGSPALRVSPMQRQHLGKIVQSFAQIWRQYLHVATAAAQQLDPRSPTAAQLPAETVAATAGQMTVAQGTFPGLPQTVADRDRDSPGPSWNVRSPLTPMTPFTPVKYPGQPPSTFHRVTEAAQRHLIRAAVDAFVSLSELKATYFQRRAVADAEANETALTASPTSAPDPKVLAEGLNQLEAQINSVQQRILRIGGPEALEHAQQRLSKKLLGKRTRNAAHVRQTSPEEAGSSNTATRGSRPPPLSRVEELDSDASISDNDGPPPKPQPAPPQDGDAVVDVPPVAAVEDDVASFVPAGQLALINGRKNAPGAVTSASETEVSLSETEPGDFVKRPARAAPPTRRARTTPFGPPLPPQWTVGKDGVSRPPPPPSVEKQSAEKKNALEFKTAQSFKARVALRQAAAKVPSEAELAKKGFSVQVEEAMWAAFEKELTADPPVLARVPAVLRMVADGLIEVLPKRLRTQVGEEIRDTLDWDMVKYNSLYDTRAIAAVLRYVTDKVCEYGAPARETEVRMRLNALLQRLELVSRMGDAAEKKSKVILTLLDSFKFMTASVRQLHQDISTIGLSVIAPELAAGYLESARQYAAEWMKPPAEWQSSKAWAAKALTAAVEAGLVAPGPTPTLTDDELRLTVGAGLLSLISSAKKKTTHRWADFPGDVLHFEATSVFTCANTLQVCALRLMVTSTVSMLLSARIPKSAAPMNAAAAAALARVHAAQGRAAPAAAPAAPQNPSALDAAAVKLYVGMLDSKLKAWFGVAPDPVTGETGKVLPLPKLKDEVVAETNHFLVSRSLSASNGGVPSPTVFLTEAEKRVLINVLEKVSSTESVEYIAFEGKLTAALTTALRLSLTAHSDTSSDEGSVDSDDDSPTAVARRAKRVNPFEKLGVVEEDMGDLATDLDNIARLNVEVHRDAYLSHLLPPRPTSK